MRSLLSASARRVAGDDALHASLNAAIFLRPSSAGAAQPAPRDGGFLRRAALGVKLNLCVSGWPATAASAALSNYVAPYTSTAVARLEAAGALVAAATNMDEFGMGSASAFSAHGAARNPYSAPYAMLRELASMRHRGSPPRSAASDLAPPAAAALELSALADAVAGAWLTPGGSSGGSAAAVACGQVAAALGSDTGGSVRQPAAFCGVVGLKPSFGRVSRHGLIAYASSLDTVGFLARSVDDAALLCDLAAGRDDAHDDTCLRLAPTPLAQLIARDADGASEARQLLAALLPEGPGGSADESGGYLRVRSALMAQCAARLRGCASAASFSARAAMPPALPLAGLRIGVPTEYLVEELPPHSRATLRAASALLADAGATVVPVSLPSTAAALSAYYLLASAEAASNLARYDGVRYGARAPHESRSGDAAASARTENAAERLHALYSRTRSGGFGGEVQRRLMVGNFALSHGAREAYYGAASAARRRVVADFNAVFRPASAAGASAAGAEAPLASHALNRYLARQSALGEACAAAGVDVLLAPATPSPPWLSAATAARRAVDVYLQDVMTVPASLARLPALALPLRCVAQPGEALDALAAAVAVWCSGGARGGSGGGAFSRDEVQAAAVVAARVAVVPSAVQIIGRYGDEATLLTVGAALEAAAGFVAPDYVLPPR